MTIVTKLELPRLDYTDPAMRGDRFHAAMRELQEQGWLAAGPFGCVVLDREAIEFFLRSKTMETPGRPMIEWFDVGEGPLRDELELNLLTVGGADHRRLRTLVNPALSARGVERYRPTMRRLLGTLLDRVEPDGRCEFVSAIGKPYPSQVIATILGASVDDADQLHEWSHWIERQFDVTSMAEERDGIERAVRASYAYADELIRARRAEPADDLTSRLVAVELEGDRLSDVELVNLVLNLQVGGIDTVQSQLAQTVRLFAEHPEQWRALRENPELVPAAVEEALRFEPILPFTARVLLEDLEYRGVAFPAGSAVMLCMFTANRQLDGGSGDPWAFDITADRGGARLMSFGAGQHFCVGSNLARAELEEALSLLSTRLATLEPDGEPTYGSATGLYGLDALPIRFTPAG